MRNLGALQFLDVIVVDSVAALVPKAELEGDMGMATMGMQARLMSQALRKLAAILNKAKTTCIFTNQLREKVGVMFGSPETTPGGKALKFYASVRIDIRRREAIKDSTGQVIGNHVKTKIVKNKVAPPFAEAEFDIMYNQGINREGSIIDAGLRFGVLGKKGAWIQHDGELIGQGVAAAQRTLSDKPELCELIVKQIMDKKNGVEPEEEELEPEEDGLLGITLDPDFAKNKWLYLNRSLPETTKDDQGKKEGIIRVSRFTLKGDKLDLESEQAIMDIRTQREQCCHVGGSLAFDPKGNLLVAVGDNTNNFIDHAPMLMICAAPSCA